MKLIQLKHTTGSGDNKENKSNTVVFVADPRPRLHPHELISGGVSANIQFLRTRGERALSKFDLRLASVFFQMIHCIADSHLDYHMGQGQCALRQFNYQEAAHHFFSVLSCTEDTGYLFKANHYLSVIFSHGGDVPQAFFHIHEAKNHIPHIQDDETRSLLKKQDHAYKTLKLDFRLNILLRLICMRANADQILSLIRTDDLDKKLQNGYTLLHVAVENSVAITEGLLAMGANPKIRDEHNGDNVLLYLMKLAYKSGQVVNKVLAEKVIQADPEVLGQADYDGRYPIQLAAGYNDLAFVCILLKKYQTDPNRRLVTWMPASLHLAASKGLVSMTELLLKYDADHTLSCFNGYTPLKSVTRKLYQLCSSRPATFVDTVAWRRQVANYIQIGDALQTVGLFKKANPHDDEMSYQQFRSTAIRQAKALDVISTVMTSDKAVGSTLQF